MKPGKTGFTMIELLVVVAILAVLIIMGLLSSRLQLSKARDVSRKADLDKLKVAFEHYYNDNNCYPPANVFFGGGTAPSKSVCGKPLTTLEPYLKQVPCDPSTGLPYDYYPAIGKTFCDGYRLYTRLENTKDQNIAEVGCNQSSCGSVTNRNYGVSVGTSLNDGGVVVPTATPVPVVSPTHPPTPTGFIRDCSSGQCSTWACSPNGDNQVNNGEPYCKLYGAPEAMDCGASFATESICGPYCYTGSQVICHF